MIRRLGCALWGASFGANFAIELRSPNPVTLVLCLASAVWATCLVLDWK